MELSQIKTRVSEIQETLDSIQKQKVALCKELHTFVVDKNISLDDRWDIFIQSGLGDHEGSICSWQTLLAYKRAGGSFTSVDDRYVNNSNRYSRHERVYVEDIYESLLEYVQDAEDQVNQLEADNPDDDESTFIKGTIYEFVDSKGIPFSHHSIDEWREEVLTKFIESYNFDW